MMLMRFVCDTSRKTFCNAFAGSIQRLLLSFILLLPGVGHAGSLLETSEPLDLTFKVKGIRSDQGVIMLQLFDSEKEFSDAEGGNAMATYIARAKKEGVSITIHGVEKGVYAITLIHDENTNGQLDWDGRMPSEGYAYSRGAGKYSLPAFEDASITLLKRSRTIALDLVYH